MSRLPKLPTVSGIPSSGLPSPAAKRRPSTGTTGKSTLVLTPEQEALLQAAMEKYNPTPATELNDNNQTSPTPTLGNSQANSSPPSMPATNNQPNRKLGRKPSVSRMTRPTLPPLTEKSAAIKQPSIQQTTPTPHTVSSKLSNSGLPASNLSPPLQRSLSGQNSTLPSVSNPAHQRLQAMAASQQRPASPSLALFSIGDRVTIESMNITGTLRFLGPIDNKSGTWAGIEVDVPGTGKNDGSANGKSYFTCPPKSGIFALSSKLTKLKEVEKAPKLPQTSSINNAIPSTSSNSNDKASSGIPSSLATPNLSKHAQNAAIAAGRITAGSRASRYIGVTASQLKQKTPSTITTTPDTTPNTAPSGQNKTKSLGLVRPGSLQNLKSPPPTNGRQYRNRKDSSSSTGSTVSKTSGLPRSRSVTPNPPNESQHTSDSENTITGIKEEMSNKSLQEKVQKLLSDPDTSVLVS